jgi:CBS domain-containing protein
MGFRRVFDYLPGRIGWLVRGLPTEGQLVDGKVGPLARRDVPRVGPDATIAEARAAMGDEDWCVVVNEEEIVLGLVRSELLGLEPDRIVATVMIPGPGTVRPHVLVHELARQLDRDGLDRTIVTTTEGRLIGLLRREDLRVAG